MNFKELGFSIISSVQKGVYTVTSSVGNFFTAVAEIGTLRKDYALLTQKLDNYEFLQRNNAEITKENERLREQLGFSSSYEYKNIPAQIIGRETNALYSGITVNKGSHQNVKKGMPVIAIQNGNIGLVGKVVAVGIGTSIVMPVYDYQCNVSARIENTRDIGIVTGNGSAEGTLTMNYVKKRVLDELHYGDIIVTSGENENYVRDIPVGTISNITIFDYDTSLEISLTPIIDFSRLDTVIIVDQKSFEGNE